MTKLKKMDAIARRNGGKFCQYCCYVSPYAGEYVREHLVPRCKGGPDQLYNRVMACRECDAHKAGRMPNDPEFIRYLLERRRYVRRMRKLGLVAKLPTLCPQDGHLHQFMLKD